MYPHALALTAPIDFVPAAVVAVVLLSFAVALALVSVRRRDIDRVDEAGTTAR